MVVSRSVSLLCASQCLRTGAVRQRGAPRREAGPAPALPGLPEGVEAVRRGPYPFLLNHGRTPAAVPLPSPRTDLLTGRTHHTGVRLDRFAVMVLAPPESAI
ncbi:Beta-galactosidase C-terminal domain [Streptomyces malaysiensis]|uniref:Beta-galactosidase C-terminal domain n=1 Tax=Streptomyces malaysiensis TaxID=92644 RepID=UPI003556916A